MSCAELGPSADLIECLNVAASGIDLPAGRQATRDEQHLAALIRLAASRIAQLEGEVAGLREILARVQ